MRTLSELFPSDINLSYVLGSVKYYYSNSDFENKKDFVAASRVSPRWRQNLPNNIAPQ